MPPATFRLPTSTSRRAKARRGIAAATCQVARAAPRLTDVTPRFASGASQGRGANQEGPACCVRGAGSDACWVLGAACWARRLLRPRHAQSPRVLWTRQAARIRYCRCDRYLLPAQHGWVLGGNDVGFSGSRQRPGTDCVERGATMLKKLVFRPLAMAAATWVMRQAILRVQAARARRRTSRA